MIPLTLSTVAAATGAQLIGDGEAVVTSVEFDSRKVTPGALFVALAGDHVDGHDYAAAAAERGAVAVLGSRAAPELPTLVANDVIPGDPSAAVLAALSALAHHVVTALVADGLTVIGVTGSAGKTSTKDLIAAVATRAGTVVAPPESFNNELGHPYTVLRAGRETDYLVLELSARGIGHIAQLARIAPPRIGAVLNVGSAHLGEFGSRDAIALAKGELVEALPSGADGGVAILNADDDRVAAMASRTSARIVRVSAQGAGDINAVDITLDQAARARFMLTTPEGSAPVALQVVGAHQVSNALVAAAVGRAIGLGVDAVAEALSAAAAASHWRMEVTELPGGITLINDAYNANPESMRAALTALERIGAGRRRFALLGEMAELGDDDGSAHRDLGARARGGGNRVIAVGDGARAIAEGAAQASSAEVGEPSWYPTVDAAVAALCRDIAPGDVILVKASRAVGLEHAAFALRDQLPSIVAGTTAGSDEERA